MCLFFLPYLSSLTVIIETWLEYEVKLSNQGVLKNLSPRSVNEIHSISAPQPTTGKSSKPRYTLKHLSFPGFPNHPGKESFPISRIVNL